MKFGKSLCEYNWASPYPWLTTWHRDYTSNFLEAFPVREPNPRFYVATFV